MALYRTALRLAAIEGLRPAKLLNSSGPWPTLAQARVFDTRLDPIEDIAAAARKAVIVVYTEHDIGYASQRRGGVPFRREVDLVFEISQIAAAPSDADPNLYIAGVPETDAELEAEIDRIETEIAFALFYAPGGLIWRRLTGNGMVTDPRSAPHRTSEENLRLAMRTVTWKVQVPDDAFDPLPREEQKGLDRLPEPLKSVAYQLREAGWPETLIGGLAEGMPAMPLARPLKSIGLNVEIVPRGGTPTGTANMSSLIALPLWTERRGSQS
jgi:hypothetical protein